MWIVVYVLTDRGNGRPNFFNINLHNNRDNKLMSQPGNLKYVYHCTVCQVLQNYHHHDVPLSFVNIFCVPLKLNMTAHCVNAKQQKKLYTLHHCISFSINGQFVSPHVSNHLYSVPKIHNI